MIISVTISSLFCVVNIIYVDFVATINWFHIWKESFYIALLIIWNNNKIWDNTNIKIMKQLLAKSIYNFTATT